MIRAGAQVHQAAMVSHLTPYDPVFQERVRQMTGGGSVIGAQQAYGLLYGTLVRQATVLSYIDVFRVLSFLCVLCIPAALLFEKVKKKPSVVAVH